MDRGVTLGQSVTGGQSGRGLPIDPGRGWRMARATAGGDGGAGPGGPEFDPPFSVLEPSVLTSPVVLSSPHSGRTYPDSFLRSARLDAATLRRSEDAFVDDLFEPAVSLGLPLLRAHFPRAYLDLNREPYELDPRMFDGRLPAYVNTRSVRVAGGLGTIARVVGDSQEIYAKRLPVEDALRRIDELHKPYHVALQDLLNRAMRRFGTAVLVDCHSMPSSSITGTSDPATWRDEKTKAEFVLGDRYGTSCARRFVDIAEGTLKGFGYAVERNKPYAGGFITEHYGRPAQRLPRAADRDQPRPLHGREGHRAWPRLRCPVAPPPCRGGGALGRGGRERPRAHRRRVGQLRGSAQEAAGNRGPSIAPLRRRRRRSDRAPRGSVRSRRSGVTEMRRAFRASRSDPSIGANLPRAKPIQ